MLQLERTYVVAVEPRPISNHFLGFCHCCFLDSGSDLLGPLFGNLFSSIHICMNHINQPFQIELSKLLLGRSSLLVPPTVVVVSIEENI